MADAAEDPPSSARGARVLYGRRQGHPLKAGQRALLAAELPARLVALPERGRLDPAALFAPPRSALWIEVGFGGGEHLAAQAKAHPDIGFIGCEPFVNGVARLLGHIRDERLTAIRLFMDDARLLLAALPDASVGRLFLLFPDPWPKRRHHKRRFVGPATLRELARVLQDGAEFRFASDHADYVRWTLFHTLREPAFAWTARGPADWRERPAESPPTRYESKALAAGRRPVFLGFRRVPRGSD